MGGAGIGCSEWGRGWAGVQGARGSGGDRGGGTGPVWSAGAREGRASALLCGVASSRK